METQATINEMKKKIGAMGEAAAKSGGGYWIICENETFDISGKEYDAVQKELGVGPKPMSDIIPIVRGIRANNPISED